MKHRFSLASGLALALSLAATPVFARQMEGHDQMPPMAKSGMGMGMDMMDKMTSGMSEMDKGEMKMTMGKMAAMPPAQRKKAMQKVSGTTDPAKPMDPAKMPGKS